MKRNFQLSPPERFECVACDSRGVPVREAPAGSGDGEARPPARAVSVCIPSYRGERFLPEALSGVAAQTCRDWELVLVEDGSRDGTEAMVRAFGAEREQPVVYLRNERNLGLPATRNRAAHAARGEFIAMLDADDRWAPEHLETALDVVSRTGADLVFSAAAKRDGISGALLGYMQGRPEEIADLPAALFRRCFLIPSGVLVRRRALFDVGLQNPALRYCNDLDLWFRMLRAGKRFEYTGKVSCDYRQHQEAISATRVTEMLVDRAFVYERNRDWDAVPARIRRRRRGLAWSRAAWHMLKRNRGLGLRYYAQALRARLGLAPLDLPPVSWD